MLTKKTDVKINASMLSIGLGIIVGVINLYIEFQNNNQGEYFDVISGKIDWFYAFANFIIPFLLTLILFFPLCYFLYSIFRKK